MKNLIKSLLLAVCLVASIGTLQAQKPENPQKKPRFNPEQFAQMQAKHIANEIALDDATSQRFINTFCEFQKELRALWAKPKQNKEQLTEEETGKLLKAQFEHSQKILDVRTKYYKEYSKFLSQKQILRIYELEKQMKNRFNKNAKKPQQKNGQKQGQKPGARPGTNTPHGQHHGQAHK